MFLSFIAFDVELLCMIVIHSDRICYSSRTGDIMTLQPLNRHQSRQMWCILYTNNIKVYKNDNLVDSSLKIIFPSSQSGHVW